MSYEWFLILAYLNYKTLFFIINFKGVYKAQSKIYGATLLPKKLHYVQLGSKYVSETWFVLFVFSEYLRMYLFFLAPWERLFLYLQYN